MDSISSHKRVLVIGDVMLDRYIVADEVRKSPEANIPLIYNYGFEDRLGGAGNVAINLKGLEIEPILLSLTGSDEYAEILESLCQMHGVIHYFLTDSKRPTTLKSRIVDAEFNQMFRMDKESTEAIEPHIEQSVREAIESLVSEYTFDAIIIQDYNKGLLTSSMIEFIQKIALELNIPLLVDPKANNFQLLTHCSLFKPNLKELSAAVGYSISPKAEVISDALDKLGGNHEAVYIVTMAEHGIFYRGAACTGIIPGFEIQNPDVSGAGDTVLSVLAYCLLEGMNAEAMAKKGNEAGAMVCKKKGIQAISLKELGLN